MNPKLLKFSMLLVFALCFGCKDELEGECSRNIPLSTNSVELGPGVGTATVTTGDNSGWWLAEISSNGQNLFDVTEVDVTSANFTVTTEDLTFERVGGNQINLMVTANTTGEERRFSIVLQDGNCFNGVSILQQPD